MLIAGGFLMIEEVEFEAGLDIEVAEVVGVGEGK